jgi:hypothetical protein
LSRKGAKTLRKQFLNFATLRLCERSQKYQSAFYYYDNLGIDLDAKKIIFAFFKIETKMDTSKILELLSYTVPAVITGLVAYNFFNIHTKNEEGRRRYLLSKEAQKNAMPLRLQAYERMTLFLERMSLTNLLTRISPISNDKNDYCNFVIAQIEQEFEHNLAQQIYMTDECWTIITTAKNSTIQMIRKGAMMATVTTADSLREVLLNELLEKQTPSNAALAYIKKEVSQMW